MSDQTERPQEKAAWSGGTGEWQRCPVCDGRGDHMRGFYDGPGPTSSGGTTRVACRTCNGLTVIRTVVPPRAPSTASTKDSGAVGEGGVHE